MSDTILVGSSLHGLATYTYVDVDAIPIVVVPGMQRRERRRYAQGRFLAW